MALNYGFYLTAAGVSSRQQAIASGGKMQFYGFQLGSGMWTDAETPQELKVPETEVLPLNIPHATEDPLIPMFKIEIPPSVGGFTLNEVALTDSNGVVLAIAPYPTAVLPVPGQSGAIQDMIIECPVIIGTADLVQVPLAPPYTATQMWVEAIIANLKGEVPEESNSLLKLHQKQVVAKQAEEGLRQDVDRLDSLLQSDDLDLDTLQEVIDKIKSNSSILSALSWSNLAGKPTTFPPAVHQHSWNDLQDKPSSLPPSEHNHTWDSIQQKPTQFNPTNHNHNYAELNGVPVSVYSL